MTLREVLNGDAREDRIDPRPGPEKSVDDIDLSEVVLQQFTEGELEILVRRLDDQPWSTIAEALGRSPVKGSRKQIERAL